MLPDGEHVLFTAFSTPIERARIEVLSLKTGERKVVLEGGVSGRYVGAGYLLYSRSEALFAVPFDLGRLAVVGQPVLVIQDLAEGAEDGRAGFAVSDNGTLAYITASSFTADLELVWVTRHGAVSAPITAPARFDNPALSPSGRQVAIAIAPPGGPGTCGCSTSCAAHGPPSRAEAPTTSRRCSPRMGDASSTSRSGRSTICTCERLTRAHRRPRF